MDNSVCTFATCCTYILTALNRWEFPMNLMVNKRNMMEKMENDRKRTDHDGKTHGTCKKTNGTGWNN